MRWGGRWGTLGSGKGSWDAGDLNLLDGLWGRRQAPVMERLRPRDTPASLPQMIRLELAKPRLDRDWGE